MSVPFYYDHGPAASAVMKADMHRVRLARPDRYRSRLVKEQRMGEDGNTTTVTVRAEPDAKPISGRQRHELCTVKLHAGAKLVRGDE